MSKENLQEIVDEILSTYEDEDADNWLSPVVTWQQDSIVNIRFAKFTDAMFEVFAHIRDHEFDDIKDITVLVLPKDNLIDMEIMLWTE